MGSEHERRPYGTPEVLLDAHPALKRGANNLSVLRTCVTKQTKDMRYSEAEH